MRDRELGQVYENGQTIVRQGDPGDGMFVILAGEVEVVRLGPGGETPLTTLKAGDLFGEMALFAKEPRSATVRAKGEARVLSVDRRAFMKRVHQDPALAFDLLRRMSQRIRSLDEEVARLRNPAPEGRGPS
jgi:CRP/FNR family transcriptional regulator, cyclic AMP receptor protein